MASANSNTKTSYPGLKTPFEYRILVMSTGALAPEILAELEELPGSQVQGCSSYVELFLHLERESFQLVVIIEEETTSLDSQAAIDRLGKLHRGTPVLVAKRAAMEEYLGEAAKGLNQRTS